MFDTLPLIQQLRLEHVDEEGYAALRCNWERCPGPGVIPNPDQTDSLWTSNGLYATAWERFFPNETLPTEVVGPCCAQFAVNRATVQRWPIEMYEQMRHWLWGYHHVLFASQKAGAVMEYMW
jgi:hypothetical protein